MIKTKSHSLLKSFVVLLSMAFLLHFYGCSRHKTMPELAQIDSLLLKNNYVEALKEISTINPDMLNEEERALYSLLLTQTQYKNYKPITSDSIINIAVNYYQNSDDKEKATRSLLYQGCVYEVLGNPEKAVDCYKRADESASKQDIGNKAYANLRLGVLYHETIVGANSIALEKYFEALQLYRLLTDKHYELLCLTTIGSIYRDFKDIEKQDSALFYIDSALELAKEQNDTYFQFENLFIKAEFYELLEHEYLTAKDLAVQAINIGGKEIDHPRAHFCAAKSFVKLRQIDSAYYYLDHAPKLNTARDSIMYYNLLADIAQYKNNNELWLSYQNQAISMADSILISNLNAKLFNIEKKYDLQQKELKNVSLQSRLKGAWLTVALVLLAALSLFHFLWRYRNRLRAKENEFELLKSDLSTSLSSLEQMQVTINNYEDELKETENKYRAELAQQEALVSDLSGEIADAKSSLISDGKERMLLMERIADLEAKKVQSDEIKAIMGEQIKVLHELMQWAYELDGASFTRKFNLLMTMQSNKQSATYWDNLQSLVNDLYDNILVKAQEQAGGTLRDDELNFIALYCCGFSRTAIMVCMNYKHIVTISNKKVQIAKKLGVINLDKFVEPYQR